MALAMRDIDLTAPVFERFFALHPQHRSDFINLGAAAPRMVQECVEALIGLASGEPWAETTVINFVDLHRDYGRYNNGLYDDFIDAIIAIIAENSGNAWTKDTATIWQEQVGKMKDIVARTNIVTAGN